MSRVLLVEDEALIRTELERVMTRHGHEVVAVADVAAARDAVPEDFDVVVTDLRLPGESGDQLLDEAARVPVILMTAHGSVSSAVDAMKRGAADYLTKPFDPDELLLIIGRLVERRRLERENAALRQQVEGQWRVEGMVGSSAPMREVADRIRKVAPTDATVLVLGESGTGKELVARAIHRQSSRAARAFVPVNCASIPEGLIESELFGHERGAFTGAVSRSGGLVAAAHEGTLFLDEIGELPAHAQARLLRVLQEREVRRVGAERARPVDVRVVGATHRDLPAMVEAGAFREDLYFRLRVLEIELPPLRERGDDVHELAAELLREATGRLGRGALDFDDSARAALGTHEWPGNVRELRNAIERAVILHESGPVTAELLGLQRRSSVRPSALPSLEDPSLEGYLKAFVLEHEETMSEKELAEALGISRKSLWERRARLGIPRGHADR